MLEQQKKMAKLKVALDANERAVVNVLQDQTHVIELSDEMKRLLARGDWDALASRPASDGEALSQDAFGKPPLWWLREYTLSNVPSVFSSAYDALLRAEKTGKISDWRKLQDEGKKLNSREIEAYAEKRIAEEKERILLSRGKLPEEKVLAPFRGNGSGTHHEDVGEG